MCILSILNVVGLASVAKVLLAFKYEKLPPNLHFHQANPKIPSLHDGQLQVVDSLTPFHGTTVAINSFGFGGENVHVVVKKYCGPKKQHSSRQTRKTNVIEMQEMNEVNGHLSRHRLGSGHAQRRQNRSKSKATASRHSTSKEPLRLLAVSTRTEDGAKDALQLAMDHRNSAELLAMMSSQMNVPISVLPARGYAVMKGQEVTIETRVSISINRKLY